MVAYPPQPVGEPADPSVEEIAVTVKSGSRTAPATNRSGSTVTLTATSRYYDANRGRWYGWAGKALSFRTQLPSGSWSQFATATTDAKGVARATGRAVVPRVWRVVSPEGTIIWSSTARRVRA